MRHLLLKIFGLIVTTNICVGQILNVPSEYSTIQSAMNAAESGDTVLVDEGTYYENIKFYGKSILVASKFIIDHDPSHILNTIINGSHYTDSDSASCVIFSGEDAGAVLQGFTLTEGKGTLYVLSNLNTTSSYDGRFTVEGGGVFFNKSKGTIKNNLIINNEAAAYSDYHFNGGGGVSSFCGNPKIYNNVIIHNRAISANGTFGYASGIVFNESKGTIRNNIIYHNTATNISAVFFDINRPAVFENNTVVGNILLGSRGSGGIVSEMGSIIRNNIVWGNRKAYIDEQLDRMESSKLEYCLTETEIPEGTNMLTCFPDFSNTGFMLNENSPCIDAGKPDTLFNDVENTSDPGNAQFPSLGGIRNDIGAYGGRYADIFPEFSYEELILNRSRLIFNLDVGDTASKDFYVRNLSTHTLTIDSLVFPDGITGIIKDEKQTNNELKPMALDTIPVEFIPTAGVVVEDTIWIYHNGTEMENPIFLRIKATVEGPSSLNNSVYSHNIKIFPNPASTTLNIMIPQELAGQLLQLFDMLGHPVYSEIIEGEEISIDISNYNTGIYLCKVNDNCRQVVIK